MKFLKRLFKKRVQWGYVSEVDKFMFAFRKQNPQKSASQLAEIQKFARIGRLRDPST